MSSNAFKQAVAFLKTRREIALRNFEVFFALYFPHYITVSAAPFHKEIMRLVADETVKNIVIAGFRGSGKSSIVTVAYSIWSILGTPQKKYVLIASQTQRQARQNLQNIKYELESNELLKNDFGPFQQTQDEWGSMALISSKYGAKIAAVSTEQSIRGMRHGAYRPQVIICDDIEDLSSVKTQDSRDKTYQWYKGEAFPAGSIDCRQIIVGNVLHHDSLVMRLKTSLESGALKGVYREYPLIRDGVCLWPGKYPTKESLLELKRSIDDEVAFAREYLLKIISTDRQVVQREWISYYNEIPDKTNPVNRFYCNITGVDVAISEKDSADYTAMVSTQLFGSAQDLRIYIEPHPLNERIPFPTQKERIRGILSNAPRSEETIVLIESNHYQAALAQDLRHEGFDITSVQTYGSDKRARLAMISPYLKNGIILFPRTGAETLIEQLIGFGSERYDDLVDALIFIIDYAKKHYGKDIFSPSAPYVKLSARDRYIPEWGRSITAGLLDKRF